MRFYLTALFAALLLAAPAAAYVPQVESEEPVAELVPISDSATPAVLTGAIRSSDESIRSDGADDQRAYFRCDGDDAQSGVWAVPRARAADFVAAMTALGYTCTPIDTTPKPPAEEPKTLDPRSFDLNGDVYIVWSCYRIPQWLRDLGGTTPHFLVAGWNVFQTDPELMAGFACIPVMDG